MAPFTLIVGAALLLAAVGAPVVARVVVGHFAGRWWGNVAALAAVLLVLATAVGGYCLLVAATEGM